MRATRVERARMQCAASNSTDFLLCSTYNSCASFLIANSAGKRNCWHSLNSERLLIWVNTWTKSQVHPLQHVLDFEDSLAHKCYFSQEQQSTISLPSSFIAVRVLSVVTTSLTSKPCLPRSGSGSTTSSSRNSQTRNNWVLKTRMRVGQSDYSFCTF